MPPQVKNILNPNDLEGDSVGAKYLQMVKVVSFSDLCSYLVELPVSEHGKPEVKAPKQDEIQNLMDYNTFKAFRDDGQDIIQS